jgi:hypothetical protein
MLKLHDGEPPTIQGNFSLTPALGERLDGIGRKESVTQSEETVLRISGENVGSFLFANMVPPPEPEDVETAATSLTQYWSSEDAKEFFMTGVKRGIGNDNAAADRQAAARTELSGIGGLI